MKRAVALLRGINVGRAKRVAMAGLRALVEGLGYRDVRTPLNSGNVVFSVPAKARGASGLAKVAPLAASDWSPDALRLGERVVYTWSASGILQSPVVTAMAKALGDGATSRNWATVLKLHAMLGEA